MINLLQTEITWAQLKALHQVYTSRQTKAPLFANAYLLRLKTDRKLLRYKSGNHQYIEAGTGFKAFFEINFLSAYLRYTQFFEASGVLSDGRRSYSLYDLETLLYIWKNKATLSGNLTTLRTFSGELFKGKGTKYLENNNSVLMAVYQILGIGHFPKSDPKEQQWRLIIDCPDPKRVLLCENLDALKVPEIAIELNTELWYVGGNNTRILHNLSPDKLKIPVLYMCDWDYDGLRIFENVRRILAEKAAVVQLLMPYDLSKILPVDSPHHYSKWKRPQPFSGLCPDFYDAAAFKLITRLINRDEWVEEENQELEALLKYNKVIG